MILTDEDKAKAKELGLTLEELRIAYATRITPERYAESKRAIRAEREREAARFADLGEMVKEHTARQQTREQVLAALDEFCEAQHSGRRPPRKEADSED